MTPQARPSASAPDAGAAAAPRDATDGLLMAPTPPRAPDEVDARLASADLASLATDPSISEFWKDQLSRALARARAARPGAAITLDDVLRMLDYGFKRLAPGEEVAADPALREVLEKWSGQTQPLLRRAGAKGTGLTSAQWEHLCAVAWLQGEGLFEEYLELIGPLRIRSNMPTVRHFAYARVIRQLLAGHPGDGPFDVLEIGAGGGNLAVLLITMHLVRTYVIVDLPEMLPGAARQIRDLCPDARVHLDAPFDASAGAAPGPDVHLVRTGGIADLPATRFDLLLNFNSFMEMDRGTRDFYLGEIYRVARDGAIFYNVNRRQPRLPQPDGTAFDNNPLLYPYSARDEILFWEDDPFQTAVRGWLGGRPSLAVARAARVHAAPDRR